MYGTFARDYCHVRRASDCRRGRGAVCAVLEVEKVRNDFLRRFVALFLCLSLVLGSVALRPQKVDALALEATVVAAVAVMLTACGMTYWASNKSDATEYLGREIDEYLQTLEDPPLTYEDWLDLHDGGALFDVLNNGIMIFGAAVANKLLSFCRWFVADNGVTGGGDSVVSYPGEWVGQPIPKIANNSSDLYNNGYTAAIGADGTTHVCFGALDDGEVYCVAYLYNNKYYFKLASEARVGVRIGSLVRDGNSYYGTSGVSSMTSGNGGYFLAPSDTVNLGATINCPIAESESDAIRIVMEAALGGIEPATIITPSSTVSIPPDLAEDGTIDVKPSVALNAGVSVDVASDAILTGITSEGGLTATVDVPLSGIEGFLSDILGVLEDIKLGLSSLYSDVVQTLSGVRQAVLDLPSRIAEAVRGLFVPADGFVADFVASLYASFAERVGVLTYPLAVAESFLMRFLSEPVGEPVLTWGAIQEPFSGQVLIQAGSYNLKVMLDDVQMVRVYDILQLVLKVGMAFALFDLCRKKYNAIIHGGAS